MPAQKADAQPGWKWAAQILTGLGAADAPRSADAAFRALAEKSPRLAGLTLAEVPEDGIVIEGEQPKQWPARAPRPGSWNPRGPQTTPPGMKVGDEASGGSR